MTSDSTLTAGLAPADRLALDDGLDPIKGLGFFLYRSTARPGLDHDDMQNILRVARSRNQALGLTGCLHHEDGLFFQWLEGPVDGLRQVRASLLADRRHLDFDLLDQGALSHRRFQDWRMRFSDRDRASLMDWFARSDSSTVRRGDYAGGVGAFLMSVKV
ncbi:BLUF domain-containing protein [Paracoccus nototheniae]|uniref:BLUF domain-containing protein n=1 Tax=Paracoccus nototheniae TaxID=2489002 RepID=A0ABW4DZ22_9RHOB|nr:BLUF domain-containing protein [Paracoccus nototheniae]